VPDPNYTWVPRTNVRPKEPETTTTTTTPTTNQPDVADGVHADDNGGSRAAGTADHHGDAYAHADDAAGARVGTSADHVGSAEIALSGFRPRHRYIGVP
jgi:hypothetical protein